MAKHTSTCRICCREYQGFCYHGADEPKRVSRSDDGVGDPLPVGGHLARNVARSPKATSPRPRVPAVKVETVSAVPAVPQTEVDRMLARRVREAAYMREWRANQKAKREAEGK